MTARYPHSRAAAAQIFTRWVFVATLAWTIGNLLVVQLRAPFTLRSLEGWNDVISYLLASAPFEVTPLGFVVVGWITFARANPRIRVDRVAHTNSIAAMVPILLAVDLVGGGILLLLMGAEPSPTPARLAAAWMEPGQPLEWAMTHLPMILIPRVVLHRRLRRSGLIDLP